MRKTARSYSALIRMETLILLENNHSRLSQPRGRHCAIVTNAAGGHVTSRKPCESEQIREIKKIDVHGGGGKESL